MGVCVYVCMYVYVCIDICRYMYRYMYIHRYMEVMYFSTFPGILSLAYVYTTQRHSDSHPQAVVSCLFTYYRSDYQNHTRFGSDLEWGSILGGEGPRW